MNDLHNYLPERLMAQEEREIREVDAGTFDGRGDFGSYYAFAKGVNSEFIKLHALADDGVAETYVGGLKRLLDAEGIALSGDLLDVGCAVGTITGALARLNPKGRTFGLDISKVAIDFARERYPRCTFSRHPAHKLDGFANASLDIIHAREFYPFTRTNDTDFQLKHLACFARKLKPGGALVLQMRSSEEGLGGTLSGLTDRLRGMGFPRVIVRPMIPLKLARLLRALPENRIIHGAFMIFGKLLTTLKAVGGTDFFLLQKEGR